MKLSTFVQEHLQALKEAEKQSIVLTDVEIQVCCEEMWMQALKTLEEQDEFRVESPCPFCGKEQDLEIKF